MGSRIALTPRPIQRRTAALEVAMLGHCPGRARVERLLALPAALDEMRAAGFGETVDALLDGGGGAADARELHNLPIPLRSGEEFHDIFPDAASKESGYFSLLAGDRAWLAQSVDDFFANDGEKLWLVKIPQDEGQAGFLPAANTLLHDTRSLRGIATVLVIPSVAVVALPDLERLQVPARLPDIPRVRLDNPYPRFMPCGTDLDDDHRERRHSSELEAMSDPLTLNALLQGILSLLGKRRPDVQCLFTLPLAYSGELDSPMIDQQALDSITQIREGGSGHLLRHMQFLFPYLRGPGFSLHSPVGLITGQQSAVARNQGPWRSMAARALATDALPYPKLSLTETLRLREKPGVGVIQHRSGKVSLDDERLVVPALHPSDYKDAIDRKRFDGFRSAEIMRFLGFIRRQLQALGEILVFSSDYRDPRPRLLLEQFFRRLHKQGALRGALPEDAFQITEINSQEGVMLYEIMLAPALPIDRLFLTFTNQNGDWQGDLSHV